MRGLPEDGVMGVMGVAMIPLALSAAICCICTAATVATGDKYADWATRACCWTSCGRGREGKKKNRVKLIWEKEEEKRMKNGRKGQAEGVMEEQMNRDLITGPLCPKSVG